MIAVVRATEIMFLSLTIGISLYYLIKSIVRDNRIIRFLLDNSSIPQVPNYNTTRVFPAENMSSKTEEIPEAPDIPYEVNGVLIENLNENLEIVEAKIIN